MNKTTDKRLLREIIKVKTRYIAGLEELGQAKNKTISELVAENAKLSAALEMEQKMNGDMDDVIGASEGANDNLRSEVCSLRGGNSLLLERNGELHRRVAELEAILSKSPESPKEYPPQGEKLVEFCKGYFERLAR